MSDLFSLRFKNDRWDIYQNIDRMDSMREIFHIMKYTNDETLYIEILPASIEVSEVTLVITDIKILSYTDVTWDTVAERLIEKWCSSRTADMTGPK